MGAAAILVAFCVCLVACMALGWPVYVALAAGFVLFFGYGIFRGSGAVPLLKSCGKGVVSVLNILVAFMLIGMLTASWRFCGTIPAIVSACVAFVHPAVFAVASFLMVALISVLTGTAFGAAATMGTICMTLGQTLGCNEIVVGGAILAGAYVGDRWSPLSTSAMLAAQVTGTNQMDNLRAMAPRAVVPIVASCALYLGLGFAFPAATTLAVLSLPYGQAFNLGAVTLLPALSVIVLALLKADVKLNMLVSLVLAVIIGACYQGLDVSSIARWLATGYAASVAEIAATLDGGGLVSMVSPAIIILISSTYAGLFDATGLLDGLKGAIGRLAARSNREFASIACAVPLVALSCNQTLSTILQQQILADQYPEDGKAMVLDIEDTVIVMAPLVPWSIAATVPLASIGQPLVCILLAFYLYLQPLWMLLAAVVRRRLHGGDGA